MCPEGPKGGEAGCSVLAIADLYSPCCPWHRSTATDPEGLGWGCRKLIGTEGDLGGAPAQGSPFCCINATATSLNSIAMDENELLSRFSLVPVAADLPEIRRLIQSLIADDERDSNGPLKLLCIQLFSARIPSDALLIYKAKTSSFDAACYIDIQLVCGAGLEPTKAFLRESSEADAKKLLALLEDGNSAGNFDGFTPERHLEFYRRYYGLSS
jgi:hypothetical protein